VNWSELTHAYGPATDIPGLLGSLRTAPAPRKYTDEPWFSLWSALCHQGDVYTASYAALPELVKIASDLEPGVAVECLHLAALIELERHKATAPTIPEHVRVAYDSALADARDLAQRAVTKGLNNDQADMLTIARAVFSGNLSEARRLVDAD